MTPWDNYNTKEGDNTFTANQKQDPNVRLYDDSLRPYPNETLSYYIIRIKDQIQKLSHTNIHAHIHGPNKPWWTHRSPGPCWMCDQLTLVDTLYGILTEIPHPEKLIFDINGTLKALKSQKTLK